MSDQTPHDTLFKAVFARGRSTRALLDLALPDELRRVIDLRTLRLDRGSVVGDRLGEKHADLVFSASTADGDPVFVHLLLEHKSRPSPMVAADLFHASSTLLQDWRRRNPRSRTLPWILPIVIHHGARSAARPSRLRDLVACPLPRRRSRARWVPDVPFVYFDLDRASDESLHHATELDPTTGPALWLLKYSRHADFGTRLEAEFHWLFDAFDPATEAGAKVMLRYTVLHLDPSARARIRAAAERESSRRHERGAERMAKNLLEVLLEEGRAEGRAEGQLAALRQSIARVLRRRLDVKIRDGCALVAPISDADVLKKALDAALEVDSADDFTRVLRRLRSNRNRK